MRRMNQYVLPALVACFVGATQTALAQDDPFRGETTVNVVEVPVTVIDPASGEQVSGLAAGDFVILENGKPQELSNFFEVSRAATATTETGVAGGPSDAAAHDTTMATSVRREPLEMVYFFDLFLGERRDRNLAVEALSEIFRNGVAEGERVSVVAYNGVLETLADRSDDPEELLEALEDLGYVETKGIQQAISFTNALSTGAVSGERDVDFYERRQRSREYMTELERRVGRVGDAIRATMARHARADGRKVIVIFTPGQPRTEWAPTYAPIDFINNAAAYPDTDMWANVALEAADLGFTIFAIDSSGVRAGSSSDVTVGVTDTIGEGIAQGTIFQTQTSPNRELPTGRESQDVAEDPNSGSVNLGAWLERTRKNLLLSVSRTSGGEAFFTDDLERAVTSVGRSLEGWYSLGYVADHSGDGKTYDLEVRIPGHPDYRLVHRSAYVDRPASVRAAQRLRSEMLFGGDANPLGVRIEVGEISGRFRMGAAGSKRVRIPLEVKIPYGRLDMLRRGDAYWGKVLISFLGEDGAGNQSALAHDEQTITVEAARYDEAVARGYFAYRTTVEVEGGQQKVYVGIEDTVSGRTTIMPISFDL